MNNILMNINNLDFYDFQNKRNKILDSYKSKHLFRVAVGKSVWIQYTEFNPSYNLREILNDEIVIEFDYNDQNTTWEGINFTAINLYNANISFEIWDHGGKSPHLHIHNLPIKHLTADQRRVFKKMFILKYVPQEYLPYVDFSLCGIHLIALEYSNHWKGCYGYKKLINKWNPIKNETEF